MRARVPQPPLAHSLPLARSLPPARRGNRLGPGAGSSPCLGGRQQQTGQAAAMLNADLKRKNKFSAKEPQNLAAAPAPAPLPACSLPPVPARGQQRAGSGTWQSRVIKNDRERGRGFPKGSGALLPVPPEWACTTALGGVTPTEGGLESDSSSQMGQKWGLERDSPAWPCRGSPHLLGVTVGLGILGANSPQPCPCGKRLGEGCEAGTDGQGERSRFQLLFCFPLSVPQAGPAPAPAPTPAPSQPPAPGPAPTLSFTTCWGIKGACWQQRATGARGQLLPSVWWGGGGAGAELGPAFCFSFHAPLNFAPFVSQRRAESWGERGLCAARVRAELAQLTGGFTCDSY